MSITISWAEYRARRYELVPETYFLTGAPAGEPNVIVLGLNGQVASVSSTTTTAWSLGKTKTVRVTGATPYAVKSINGDEGAEIYLTGTAGVSVAASDITDDTMLFYIVNNTATAQTVTGSGFFAAIQTGSLRIVIPSQYTINPNERWLFTISTDGADKTIIGTLISGQEGSLLNNYQATVHTLANPNGVASTDGWSLIEVAGTARALSADTATSYKGGSSLAIAAGTAGQTSGYGYAPIPVTSGAIYKIRVAYRSSATSASGLYVRISEADSYVNPITANNRSGITDLLSNVAIASANTWIVRDFVYTVPASRRWISLAIYAGNGLETAQLNFQVIQFEEITMRPFAKFARNAAQTTGLSVGSNVVFNSTEATLAENSTLISLNTGTGVITLQGGFTYELSASVTWILGGTRCTYSWYDVTGATVVGQPQCIYGPTDGTAACSAFGVANAVVTVAPNTTRQYAFRLVGATTAPTTIGGNTDFAGGTVMPWCTIRAIS